MELEVIPTITRLSKHVLRILGQNPGKFTLQGTNTYILGSKSPYVLLDCGQADTAPTYIPFLRQAFTDPALAPWTDTEKPLISDIILSHWHHDHVGGLGPVLNLLKELSEERNAASVIPPRVHKHPFPGPPPANYDDNLQNTLTQELFLSPPTGGIFHNLADGQVITLSSDQDAELQIIYTPGHTSDSIAILMAFDNALYTADTVLGHGTAVFEDLSKYILSLQRMLNPDWISRFSILYPAHGPIVQNGHDTIRMYIHHRMERESQIITALKEQPTDGVSHWSTWSLVKSIYASYPESLWLPAAHSVDLHLRKLEEDGVVKRMGGEGKDIVWRLGA